MDKLVEETYRQYPNLGEYLDPKNIIFNLGKEKDYFLEQWVAGEPGSKESPRPKEIPLDESGIEVYKESTRPIDIVGDIVSHTLVETDPDFKAVYNKFKQSLQPGQMEKRYQKHKEFGEKRPFELWSKRTGIPELFRGYTFNQFGNASAEDLINEGLYTPQQIQILNEAKQLIKNKLQTEEVEDILSNPLSKSTTE